MTRYPLRTLALMLGSVLATSTVFAHHSFAMFDASRVVTVEGTVQDFQWGNPHVWLDVVAAQSDGGQQTFGLELNGISGLIRTGWKPVTLKAADRVKVTFHPLRDGGAGGQLIEVVTADGTVLKGQ